MQSRYGFSSKSVLSAVLMAMLCVMTTGCGADDESAGEAYFVYTNPNTQVEMRDTHIIGDGGKFYAVGTCPPYWQGMSPGVKIYSSPDLINWKFEKLLIDVNDVAPSAWYRERFWAPELHKIKGKYYLTFNSENNSEEFRHWHGCAVAVADDILGEYKVLTEEKPLTPWASNDLTLFEDDDGKVYAVFNNGWTNVHRIFVAEIDLEKGVLTEEPVECFYQEPGKWDGGGIEGAHVVKNDGVYYLFYSSWTRGYAVGYATATNIRGPWKKYEKNPLFGAYAKDGTCVRIRYGEEVEEPNFPYSAAGHNQIFTGPDGRLWTSCHAYQRGVGKAYLLMDAIWFEDGAFKTNAPTYTEQRVKIGPEILKKYPGLKTAQKEE